MTKKVDRFENWISASDAAQLLSEKSGRRVDPEYITKMAKSKKQPIKTRPMGNRLLYNREDILASKVKQRKPR
jgi:20S proteasome alpha/beta subunit